MIWVTQGSLQNWDENQTLEILVETFLGKDYSQNENLGRAVNLALRGNAVNQI